MSYSEEFLTVDLVMGSKAETRAVDAFALALIKAERQVRKLFTFLVYQFPAFSKGDGKRLRETLAASTRVYFKGVVAGIDALSPVTVKELVGPEYDRLWGRFTEFGKQRNKIFHGQLTPDGVSREELLKNVGDIRLWCQTLGASTMHEFGCDGFERNSYRKSVLPKLWMRLRTQIESHDAYAAFIRKNMEVSKPARQQTAAKPAKDALP
jgi:hypothetical protein